MDPWDLLVREGPDPTLRWRWLSCLGGDLCLWILSHDKPWFDIYHIDSHGRTLLDMVVQIWALDVSFRAADQSEWIGPMKWLIRAGSDIHHQSIRGHTVLARRLHSTANFEIMARHWFDILRDCGVDIVKYFEEEKEMYENVTIFVDRYTPEYAKLERFGTCLVFPTQRYETPVVTMKYVLPPELDYEELPLFEVFKDVLGLSDSGFHLLFNATSFIHQSPWLRERDKDSIREGREREGKPVSMVRRRRKLLARLYSPRTCWSKVRSEARRAMQAEGRRSLEGGELLPLCHDPVKFLGKNGLYSAFFYKCLNLCSLSAWAFLLVLVVSLGANVLLFRLWISS
jgi:hypothetical protein